MFLQDCPEIADFFTELVDAVGDVSLQLQGDDTVQVVEGMVHPYKGRAWALQPLSRGRCGQGGRASRGDGASLQRCRAWALQPPGPGAVRARFWWPCHGFRRLGWRSFVLLLSLEPDR